MEITNEFFQYNQLVHKERSRFIGRPGLRFFVSEQDQKKIHAFMILWTGYSIRMTEQVESWIQRAGQSTQKLGLNEIGQHLSRHAEHEANHDQMLVQDLEALVQLWNKKYLGSMSSHEVRSLPLPEATQDYIRLHEEVISGKSPYCQVAIEFEIERLSVGFGPQMIENVLYGLGPEFKAGISFLEHHVVLDQGHTQFNAKLMEQTIKAGGSVNALATIGINALKIYGDFLDQCHSKTAEIFFGGSWKTSI